ncbi:glycosyltransferase [Synechococcus sp. CC9902]|uniref:glycosyltransferase n=1 Tax=Synechococcus sp. (strain CC9902) TaxID=316279 RepID=UPI001E430582|nr:glycosyltransferase [Synechococcus sp. CC9902]
MNSRLKLSVVVIAYNMDREMLRTIYSLSPAYQRGVTGSEYEVIVVDNGSESPLKTDHWISRPGWKIRFFRLPPGDVSPCSAINAGVENARASHVCVMVDGARMLSPGVIDGILQQIRISSDSFVFTLGWHLGPQPQNVSITQGYSQKLEDKMLRQARWREDGYRLFDIASLAASSRGGWFSSINESNCFAISRAQFKVMGGFDQRFVSPGGGLVNLDFFKRAVESALLKPCVLLGEGSFHQVHGGVATNVPMEDHPGSVFAEEYQNIRGLAYQSPIYEPLYVGRLSQSARRFLS